MKVGWSIACTYVSWVPLRGCNMYKIPVGTSSLNYHQPPPSPSPTLPKWWFRDFIKTHSILST